MQQWLRKVACQETGWYSGRTQYNRKQYKAYFNSNHTAFAPNCMQKREKRIKK